MSKKQIKITMPLYLKLSKSVKGKKYHINLNNYRNWHYIVSNNLKKAYKELVTPYIKNLKIDYLIKLEFVMYRPDNRVVDRANVLCIHEKFFCDALVESGCIPDDNDNFIDETSYRTGGIDKGNGRVEIIIKTVD